MNTPAPPVDDDAPLDAVEQALVRMWIHIIAAEIRATLADEQRREADEPAATRGALEQHER